MSTISAGTTSTTAFKVTSDTTGTLVLQTGAVPTTAISISASQVVTFPATTTLDFTGTLLLGDGSAAAPTLAHSGDTNTGIYFPGADQVAITTGGSQKFFVGTSLVINEGGLDFDTRIEGDTDANLFFVDASTDRIGIGTNAPVNKLDVQAGFISTYDPTNADGAGYSLRYYSNANSGSRAEIARVGGLQDGAGNNGRLEFYTSTSGSVTSKMRLDASGNLGLGVTPSAWDTTASRALQLNGGSIWSFSTSQLNLLQNSFYNTSGNLVYTNTAAASAYRQISGAHSWYTAPSGTAGNTITFTQTMTLDSNGNLGVGSTAPTNSGGYKTLSLSGSTGGQISFQQSNSDKAYIYHDTSNFNIYNAVSGPLVFWTNSAERARITAGGDLLVGTTTGSFSKIVKNLSGNYALQVINTSSTDPYCLEFNMSGVTGGTGTAFLVCYDNSNRLIIYGDGDVQNVNNSYGSLSDIKLKQDIVDAASQWDDIKNLRVRKYRFKENPDDALQIGLIAQELEEVSPGLVDESPDRDGEGNYLGTTTKSIKYSVLYMKAIKALQEAMARIEQLEAKVAALETK